MTRWGELAFMFLFIAGPALLMGTIIVVADGIDSLIQWVGRTVKAKP